MVEKNGDLYNPSNNLKNLIRKILEPNAGMRITAAQILKEPWLNEQKNKIMIPAPTDRSEDSE